MERQQCWGNVTGPRSHGESPEWTQNRNTAACHKALLLSLPWTVEPPGLQGLPLSSLSMPTCAASKVILVSLTPPTGDPGSRLALSTFWVSCNLDSGMILSQKQLIIETFILQRAARVWCLCCETLSRFSLFSFSARLQSSCIHFHGQVDHQRRLLQIQMPRHQLSPRDQNLWVGSPSTHLTNKFLRWFWCKLNLENS